MALGAAKHSRKKINRLMFPPTISAPWLGPVIKMGPGRGRGHKFGNMHFSIYRGTQFVDPGFGPGKQVLAKKPYSAKVCIGKGRTMKDRASGRLDSKFSSQTGDTVGCEWGSGNTPTKALARATTNLGRRLATVKRGR